MSKRIHPEDPRVTAYVLGELSHAERAEVERAALLNPAMQEAIDETRQLTGLLGNVLGERSLELGDERRDAIRRAGRQPVVVEELPSAHPIRRWGRAAVVLSAAAAVVVGGIWVLREIPVRMTGEGDGPVVETVDETMMRILLAPVDQPARMKRGGQGDPVAPERGVEGGGITADPEYMQLSRLLHEDPDAFYQNVRQMAMAAPMQDLARLPELIDNDYVSAKDSPRAVVPMVSGAASWSMVERFVRGEEKLPPRRAVRVEELINHVVYQDDGDAEAGGIRLGAELVRCPWDEGRMLLGVLLRNDSGEMLPVSSVLQLDVKPDVIRSYRLVGYAGTGTGGSDTAVRGLPPGWSNFVLYELTPATREVADSTWVAVRVGMTVGKNRQQGLMVPATTPPRDWENASETFKTASVLAGYGLLLRDSAYRGSLDAPMLTALAGEALEEVSDGDLRQREALQLVIDSRGLLEGR